MSSISIRRLSADSAVDRESWATIRAICCRTGNNGEPIADDRREFFSKIWIEPYEKILPEWAYVAEADSTIVGYLTGCPHTKIFPRQALALHAAVDISHPIWFAPPCAVR